MTITKSISEEKVAAVKQMIEASRKIVITCHKTPDGDALGSSLGLAAVLAGDNKQVQVITPDTPPKLLKFLPGAENIVIASRYHERAKHLLDNADLVFCMDYNAPMRIDRLEPLLMESGAPRIIKPPDSDSTRKRIIRWTVMTTLSRWTRYNTRCAIRSLNLPTMK